MEWYFIFLIVAGSLVLGCLLLVLILKIRRNQKIKESEAAVNEKVESTASHLSTCFGGNDNIVEIKQSGSRVNVTLKDPSKVDKTAIDKELNSVMYMGNKVVFVIGSKSEDFSRLLQENIEKTK